MGFQQNHHFINHIIKSVDWEIHLKKTVEIQYLRLIKCFLMFS